MTATDENRAFGPRRAIYEDALGRNIIAMHRASRRNAGKQAASFDIALHAGDVLYGNVGAVDRLDFTVIGPAVNEVARIEALCEPLGRNLLVSEEVAGATGASHRLRPLGRHTLRAGRDLREIYGLEPGP